MTQQFEAQRTAITRSRRAAVARGRTLCTCTHARNDHDPAAAGGTPCYRCPCTRFEEAAE